MSEAEWEALCDGCGRCCCHKLEFEDDGEIAQTDIACKLLNIDTARCRNYPRRQEFVPDCLRLTPELVPGLSWLPQSCAYRRLSEGKGLPDWHPLITGDRKSVVRAGISVRGKVVPEDSVHPDDWEERLIVWFDEIPGGE
ncbi:MAG: YcgN family cysteine cluster protein [Gammaproteobacteria bacterium]|nr:YcgN family cysteine cluster protein [Gammaproteobacteria bacterium]